jgi:hypothetical protein
MANALLMAKKNQIACRIYDSHGATLFTLDSALTDGQKGDTASDDWIAEIHGLDDGKLHAWNVAAGKDAGQRFKGTTFGKDKGTCSQIARALKEGLPNGTEPHIGVRWNWTTRELQQYVLAGIDAITKAHKGWGRWAFIYYGTVYWEYPHNGKPPDTILNKTLMGQMKFVQDETPLFAKLVGHALFSHKGHGALI